MAEECLDGLLKGDIEVEIFINWLLLNDFVDEKLRKRVSCGRGEFISYFLNTIHEEAPRNDVFETPHKKKKIETTQTAVSSERKRINLFSETKQHQNNKSVNSTPRNKCELSLEESPISPLYRNHNHSFSTPKPKKKFEKSPLCLADFIVQNGKSSNKKKKVSSEETKTSKRINPTSLTQQKVNLNFDRCQNFMENAKEIPAEAARSSLVEERIRIVSRGVPTTPSTFRTFSFERKEIVADLNFVTQRDSLDVLIRLYGVILRNNLALNLSSELYFVVSLLFSKRNDCVSDENLDVDSGIAVLNESHAALKELLVDSQSKRISLNQLFGSVHNVVYFSIKTIEEIIDVFQIFDKATLKLLADHKYVSTFSPQLRLKLTELFQNKIEQSEEFYAATTDVNVCFNSDTDNRANFPNDQAFNAFRKQRDLFYEILRIWEKNHLTTGFNFTVALSGKIRALLSLHHEGINFMHLAKLFKNQLLSTYNKQNSEETVNEEQLSFLSSIPNVDLDKVNRLKTRLVTKQSPNNINPSPDFTGIQEFYKDFLLVASTHVFIQHVKDVFITEILQLNDTNFTSTELESDSGNLVDVSTQKTFLLCIKSLRILAKFLGFLDALPYRTDATPSELVTTTQLNIRQNSQPNFDVAPLISDAIRKKTLVLLIPWVTKYISMLDYVSLRLPYYISIIKQLFHIYHKVEMDVNNLESSILIKLCLGWLFELPNVPGYLYYNFEERSETITLNELHLVDQNTLMVCCPYLKSIKKLLRSNSSNTENVTIKHITPLTAVQSPTRIAKKRLEMQLEDAFFSGQPVSVKKTVDFVSERIASSCVKHICNSIVPVFKKQAFENWKTLLDSSKPITESSKAQLKRKSNEFAEDCLNRLLNTCRKEIQRIVTERVPAGVEALLALDVLPQTKEACVSIAKRLCIERTEDWIVSHVVIGVFTKDFENEILKYINNTNKKTKEKTAFVLPLGGRNVLHNENTRSAVDTLDDIREMCLQLLEQPSAVNANKVNDLLESCSKTINERCDVNDCILNLINTVLVDLFLFLVAHKTIIASQDSIQNKFLQVWKTYSGDQENLFKSLICPRNVMLLAQSSKVNKAWNVFAKFAVFLLNEKIMTCESFESQCIAVFRTEWDSNSLKNITDCLNAFLKYYSDCSGSTSKFTLLISFLSEFCCDFDV